MHLFSIPHTHTWAHYTQELAPTQDTNFQFSVEWEISLPPASTIFCSNLEGQGLDSSACVNGYICVCTCEKETGTDRKQQMDRQTDKGKG